MWYPAALANDEAPTEPLTLADVRAQSHIDFDDDDVTLNMLIPAARDHVERYCGTRLATNTVIVKCDAFTDFAWFPEAPLQSVTSIAYIDPDGTTQTLSTDVYEARTDGLDASIALKYAQNWPAILQGSRITVTAAVGYATVPPAVKHAMLLHVADAYMNRENKADVGFSAFDSLLSNFRR